MRNLRRLQRHFSNITKSNGCIVGWTLVDDNTDLTAYDVIKFVFGMYEGYDVHATKEELEEFLPYLELYTQQYTIYVK